jgi:hypothetical protein
MFFLTGSRCQGVLPKEIYRHPLSLSYQRFAAICQQYRLRRFDRYSPCAVEFVSVIVDDQIVLFVRPA